MQTAAILAIGTELTLGRTIDTNSAWLARQLAAHGIITTRQLTVADDLPAITSALHDLTTSADLLLITGGLGPTADDLTRPALAAAAGQPLVEDHAAAADLRTFFAARHRACKPENLVQAQRPATAKCLRNPVGTAPGLQLTLDHTPVFALPGVPHEMQTIYQLHVEPYLTATSAGRVLRTRELHTVGVGEAAVGQALADLMQRGRNPEIGTTAKLGIVSIRINAAADSSDAALELLAASDRLVSERLGDFVFGRDDQTLPIVVNDLLRQCRATVCLAESCTGGLIAKLLTDAPGASDVLLGGIVCYANQAKQDLLSVTADQLEQHGAVSSEVAVALAHNCRSRFRSDYALSVTGIAGPGGGSPQKPVGLVFIGLATPTGTRPREYHFGPTTPRDQIRLRSANAALSQLRRALLGDNAHFPHL